MQPDFPRLLTAGCYVRVVDSHPSRAGLDGVVMQNQEVGRPIELHFSRDRDRQPQRTQTGGNVICSRVEVFSASELDIQGAVFSWWTAWSFAKGIAHELHHADRTEEQLCELVASAIAGEPLTQAEKQVLLDVLLRAAKALADSGAFYSKAARMAFKLIDQMHGIAA